MADNTIVTSGDMHTLNEHCKELFFQLLDLKHGTPEYEAQKILWLETEDKLKEAINGHTDEIETTGSNV